MEPQTPQVEYQPPNAIQAGIYATRGWTTRRGINRLILPYLSTHLWGWLEADSPYPKPIADYEAFEGIGGKTAAKLLQLLPAANLRDRQNNAPQCGELLKITSEHPGEIELIGYAIGPGRYDERITIEGFIYYTPLDIADDDACATGGKNGHNEIWNQIANKLELNTHLAPPDEIHHTRARWNPAKSGWWVWWD